MLRKGEKRTEKKNQVVSQQENFAERRQFPRFPVQWKLKYRVLSPDLFDSEPLETTTLDVGSGGLGFVALSPLKIGRLCTFALYPPISHTPFIAVARIRWQRTFENQLITGAQWVCWANEPDKELIMRHAKTMKQSQDEPSKATVWL